MPNISDFGDENDLIRRGDALKAIHNEQVRQYDCGQAAGACVVAAEPPSSGMG